MLNYCWKHLPIRGVCVCSCINSGVEMELTSLCAGLFSASHFMFLQFCPLPTILRVCLAVAIFPTVIEQLRNNETNNGMGQNFIMRIVIIFSNLTHHHTPHAARRREIASHQKTKITEKWTAVIKGSSRLREFQLIPSQTPLASLLSLSPASSPSYPEPPSSRQEIYLDNSRDFLYEMVVQIKDHDGE